MSSASASAGDTGFTGSIPALYERYLGPLLFQPYADDIALRARATRARRVLEIAAGTGIVTRAVSAALPSAEYVATDLNDAMIAFARRRSDLPAVRWSTADAQALPFEDGRFDLVICQFGVMFFPERVRALREARRVLSPGGTYLFNVWDNLEHNDVARIVSDAAATVFPSDPPLFLRRTPHGHGDPAALEGDLRTAGFTEITWEAVEKRTRAASAREAAFGLCAGTPLRHEIVARDPDRLEEVIETATSALRRFCGGEAVDGLQRAFVFAAR